MSYKVKNGVIYSKKGIPHTPRFIADGRLDFRFEEAGILQVDYRSPAQVKGNETVFLRRLWDGFRYFLEKESLIYKPGYENTAVWPFCVEADWNFFDGMIRHRVMAVEEAIVIQISTPAEMRLGTRFKLEFYNSFGLTPRDEEDLRFCSMGVDRRWDQWKYENDSNLLLGGFSETVKQEQEDVSEYDLNNYKYKELSYKGCELHIGIGADFTMNHVTIPYNTKYILSSPELQPNSTYSFIIAFDPDKQQLIKKLSIMTQDLGDIIKKQYERYQEVIDKAPRLKSPYKLLNNYLSLIPLYHESLKVNNYPGAIKSNSYAWVWGWDGMTASYATAYWNDIKHLRDMLKFFKDTASEDFGIALALRHDMSFALGCAMPSQGMYITLLQLYYSMSGDVDFVKEVYPFVKWIFEKTLSNEVGDTGLCEGTSMFPDFPTFMKETGKDLSGFNNTIFYCTVRSMEYIAVLADDAEMSVKAGKVMKSIEKNFLNLFFDKEKGYIVSSVDSVTLEKRNCYNSNSVKWENSYCHELMEPVYKECLEFFENNIVCKSGLREIPVWSEAYDMDANQLHCWWPVTGEYFIRLANEFDRKDLIEKWIGWINYWSEMLMCPEGVSCYIETDKPDLDRWTSLPGLWYGYNMRGWYQAALHGVFGLDMDAGGITFFPYSGEEMTLKNLHYMDQAYDIEMKGSGQYIQSIEVGSTEIKATNKLPVNLVSNRKNIKLKVNRVKENPYKLYIKYGYGIVITKYRYENDVINAEIKGMGTCRLKVAASRIPVVFIDEKKCDVAYDNVLGIATIEIYFKKEETKNIVIK